MHAPYPPSNSFIEPREASWRKDGAAVFAIAPRDEEGLVGTVGLEPEPHDRAVAETGHWVGLPHQGRGYATEALRHCCRWGFEALGLRRINARTFGGNAPSECVLEKADFGAKDSRARG